MRGVVRGLSFGFLLAAAAFGGALIEHYLLSSPAAGAARSYQGISHSSRPGPLPLRGSLDKDAPLLAPFGGPETPVRPARKHRAPAKLQLAALTPLDTQASDG